MKNKNQQHKTRFIAFVATSIDGRISLTNKTLPDWTSKEDSQFLEQELSKVEAVVVGRNTYQAAVNRLRKRNTYVISSRPKTLSQVGTVTFVNINKIDIKELLSQYKTVAVLGGNRVYQMMLEKGLLEEIFVTIEPLIFGRGKEMFIDGIKTTKLKLLSKKQLNDNGTFLLHYKVKK